MQPAATAATAGERACCRLVRALGNESLVAVEFMDECDAKVSDVMVSSNHEGAGSIVWPAKLFLPSHLDTGALLLDERVIASNSTSEMSLMQYGHLGTSC